MSVLRKLFASISVAMILAIGQWTTPARAEVVISFAPPILPVYRLPVIPGPDYIWAPGYWAYDYDDNDYFWVPGTWVLAPEPGLLWTPGYWGCDDGHYFWHAGYWGPHVGFYGGINYGFGYGGYGYEGGHWDHGSFYYNTAVYHVDKTIIHNTYDKSVTYNKNITKVSFNGGKGTSAKPNAEQLKADKEKHVDATTSQTEHEHSAKGNRELFAKVNHGKPTIAATAKAGVFTGAGITSTRGTKALDLKKTVGTPKDPSHEKVSGTPDHKDHKTIKSGGTSAVGNGGGTEKAIVSKPPHKVVTHTPTAHVGSNVQHAHPQPQPHNKPPAHSEKKQGEH